MSQTNDMQGKTCVVTGSTAGLGRAVAGEMAARGARVVVVARDAARGQAVVEQIKRESGNPAVELALGDLLSRASIDALADDLVARFPRIDVLVNNAGGTFTKRAVTQDGLEATFALNVLATHQLTERLIQPLQAARGRVINVATAIGKGAKLNLSDLQSEKGYMGLAVYSRAKLAVMMLTIEQAQRHPGVTFNVLHPGVILGTNFGSDMPKFFRKVIPAVAHLIGLDIPIEKAVEKYVYLATSPELAGVSGRLFVESKEEAPPRQAQNEAVRAALWSELERLTTAVRKAA